MTSLSDTIGLSLLLLCAGCAGQADSGPASGAAGTTGAAGTMGAAGTGGAIPDTCPDVRTVLETYCIDCHVTPPQPVYANFDLESTDHPELRLVGVPAYTGVSGLCAGQGNLLDRGTLPATGIFIDKINFTQSCGSGMPYLGSKMSDTEIACLQAWANGLVMLVGQ